MQLLSAVYRWEVAGLHYLQELPCFAGHWRWLWLVCTKLGDPAWTFLVYFPLLFPLSRRLALRCLLAGVLSEFLNGVLKWCLQGERPYWYVLEHRESGLAHLNQFQYTCETGPGSPSGHVMVTASVFFVLIRSLNRLPELNRNSHNPDDTLAEICGRLRIGHAGWVFYTVVLVLVAVSRLYIAAHFPHQVLLGVVAGVAIGYWSLRMHPWDWQWTRPLMFAAALILLGVCTWVYLHLVGLDPDWSIPKAYRYCERPEWIHASTTPLAALFRDIGALGGLALAIRTLNRRLYSDSENFGFKLKNSVFVLIVVQLFFRLTIWAMGYFPLYLFYCATFLQYVVIVVFVIYDFVSLIYCGVNKK